MQPQNNNYDFIINNAGRTGAGDSKKQRLIQVSIIAAILLIVIGALYLVFFAGKKDDTQKILPIYGSLLDLKDISELASKELKNSDELNRATTNIVIINSELDDLNKYVDKKTVTNAKKMAVYRNDEYINSLAEAKQNGTYEKSYKAILANRLDLNKELLVTGYSSVNDQNLKKILEKINSEISTANGAQIMPASK